MTRVTGCGMKLTKSHGKIQVGQHRTFIIRLKNSRKNSADNEGSGICTIFKNINTIWLHRSFVLHKVSLNKTRTRV